MDGRTGKIRSASSDHVYKVDWEIDLIVDKRSLIRSYGSCSTETNIIESIYLVNTFADKASLFFFFFFNF